MLLTHSGARRALPALVGALILTIACGGGSSPSSPTSTTPGTPAATPTATPSPTPSGTPGPLLSLSGTIFADPDILTSADRTAYSSMTDQGMGRRRNFDRRIGAFAEIEVFLFRVTFSDGLTTELQVNAEFGSLDLARAEALKYATIVGRLPTVLRTDMQAMWIHKGRELFGGGNNSILIHTEQTAEYERSGILEETLVHEASHTSLDSRHAAAAGWIDAQQRDGDFISTYARENPTREDVAESFLMWLALRHRPGAITRQLADTIQARMPNRLRYFDAQAFSVSPM